MRTSSAFDGERLSDVHNITSVFSVETSGVPNEHFSQNWLYDVVNASKVLLRQPMLIFNFPGKKYPLFLLLASTQQDVLLTHPNNFPFSQAKGVISTARVGWFSRALTCFARSNIHIKNYSAIARRKNIPFYPARTGINFSYFQLARRSFRFPSQLTSQFFFFQLAQILPEERVFCRAAPSGTPETSIHKLKC